jgi:hypothetical protein
VPFTRDHAALTRAVANLSQSVSGDPLSLVMTEAERSHALPMAEDALRDVARAQTLRAAEEQVLDLGDLAERLGPLDGEKHVVLLTEGYEGRTMHPFDVRAVSLSGRSREVGEPMMNVFGGRSFSHALANEILRVHHVFQRENVLLHAIDLAGVTHTTMSSDAHAVRITDAETETVEVTVPEGTRVAKALLRVDGRLGFSRS